MGWAFEFLGNIEGLAIYTVDDDIGMDGVRGRWMVMDLENGGTSLLSCG